VTVVECETPPLVPVIVIVLEVEPPPGPVRVILAVVVVGFGANTYLNRGGSGPTLKVTEPVKPLPRTTVIVYETLLKPPGACWDAGDALREKSPVGDAAWTTRVAVVE
jgi:hypothetical protein